MVRASFRLWAGIAFWGILISAFVINDGVWPLKGFWPPALCAFAIGALAILFVGISYWSPLRSLVFLPDTDVTEYLAKISSVPTFSEENALNWRLFWLCISRGRSKQLI